jgi:nitrate/nitrite transporter NarK
MGMAVLPGSLTTSLCLFSMMMVTLSYLPVFWAIPTEILSDTAAAGALGVASMIANIAGFFGPSVFGYLHTRTGSLASGFAAMAVCWAAAGILMLFIPGMRRKARDASAGVGAVFGQETVILG